MKREVRDFVRYRMARSKESLDAAKILLDAGHLLDAVSRLYYACFYVASALLLTQGLSSSKHSGILSLLAQHWVKPGHLPAPMGRFYNELFQRREKADYRDAITFSEESVQAWYEQAQAFVAEVSRLIGRQLQTEPGQD